MQLFPAIDLRGGCCVRLRQGDYAQETVFGEDPAAMARRWQDEGGDWLHVVDLDGARTGSPVNSAAISAIVRALTIPCQLGGGIRSAESIRAALDLGVTRVILGTRAIREPDWFAAMTAEFPGKLVLGVDARAGKVAVAGWHEEDNLTAGEVIARHRQCPIAAVVYTDIAKDGMMAGPNFAATAELQQVSPFPVIASGGVTTIDDVLELRRRGIGACILGRTLYEGTMNLTALRARLSQRD